jgi:hypothetical protein
MATKVKTSSTSSFRIKPRVKRKGIHAKTKQSKSKSSKNYVKAYVSQGK